MLSPIKFDNEVIFEPETWDESSAVIETVNETEAGTDQIAVTRYDKLTVSCAFLCSSVWAKKFKQYSKQDEIAVSIFDVTEEQYKVRTMRIRDFKMSLIANSWKTPNTHGLWNVSFNLVEF
ncbi:MAG: hypothetical protein IJU07_06630 [Synergistaceae bacterium]|nr:hypothetical protein [Synergistaceae bacterium]